jgi:hypothetical protein
MSYQATALFLCMLLVTAALYSALHSISLIAKTYTASDNGCSRTEPRTILASRCEEAFAELVDLLRSAIQHRICAFALPPCLAS